MLGQILLEAGISFAKADYGSIPVSYITYDSRRVTAGSLFVAIRGYKSDGHQFIHSAIENGATCVIGEEPEAGFNVPYIRVQNSRAVLGSIAAAFYDNPANSEEISLVGITGTNGKSSTALFAENLLTAAGISTGVIGTIFYKIGDQKTPAERTTPESSDLQRIMAQMRDEENRIIIMEASSHGLKLDRLSNIRFDIAAFINLSPEHLDFHLDMENYFKAKRSLFYSHLKDDAIVVINIDDSYGRRLYNELTNRPNSIITFGRSKIAQWRVSEIKSNLEHLSYILKMGNQIYPIKVPLIGNFNVDNTAIALAICVNLFPDKTDTFVEAMSHLSQVPGRLEKITDRVFVDYAHTPDALEKVLSAMKFPGYSLTVVFGAGGDRDQQKRQLMGKVASEFADKIILTNDNPRSEEPREITDAILQGISDIEKTTVIFDRKEAIERVLEVRKENEIILIAGKGHEEYQEIGSEKIPFSDGAVIREILGLV